DCKRSCVNSLLPMKSSPRQLQQKEKTIENSGGRSAKAGSLQPQPKQERSMKQIPKLILLTLAFGLAAGVGAPAQAADKKPNILMLMQDDTGWNDFGCYS